MNNDTKTEKIAEIYKGKVGQWIKETDRFLFESLPLIRPFSTNPNIPEGKRGTLGVLSTACYRTAGSCLTLIEHAAVWDAEIINRSHHEGSLKFLYLLDSLDDFEIRYDEFSNDLFQIELLQQHKKAQILLNEIDDSSSVVWQPIKDLILSDEEFKYWDEKYPKSLRRRLQEKWGFTGLIRSLSKSNSIKKSNQFNKFLHSYSMASNVHHMSYTGVSIFMERENRSENERDFAYISHACRLLSDIHSYTFLRTLIALKFVNADLSLLFALMKKYEPIRDELSNCILLWSESEYPHNK